MRKRKNAGILTRIFRKNSFFRIALAVSLLIAIFILCRNLYNIYQIHRQETQLLEERERLLEEKEQLKEKAESLRDPKVIEKKAREDLGLVKENEVPYVK